MSVSAAALRKLALLDLSSEQMAGVLDILADAAEADDARKEAQRNRTRKHRLSRDGNVTVTDQSHDSDVTALSPKKVSPTPPSKKNPLPPSANADGITPRRELKTVLDDEHAEAVLDHRQKLRKPLSTHAAKLLAGKLARCPDPNAAADTMIARGWLVVEPDWIDRANNSTGPPGTSAPRRNGSQEMMDACRKYTSRPNTPPAGGEFTGATIEASVIRRNS